MIHKMKALYDNGKGSSIRSIANELGIARNTVRKYLRLDEAAVTDVQENRERHKAPYDYRDYIIHHSDRGSQYASIEFQKLSKQYGMTCSMSRKGDCRDNAVAESFCHSLKTEWTTDGFSGYLWKKLPILDKIAYLIETPAKPEILCLGPESIFIDIIL